MRYKPEWKARGVRVGRFGVVSDRTGQRGTVRSRTEPGAKSPGGMVTDTIWVACKSGEDGAEPVTREFASMTQAIGFLLGEE